MAKFTPFSIIVYVRKSYNVHSRSRAVVWLCPGIIFIHIWYMACEMRLYRSTHWKEKLTLLVNSRPAHYIAPCGGSIMRCVCVCLLSLLFSWRVHLGIYIFYNWKLKIENWTWRKCRVAGICAGFLACCSSSTKLACDSRYWRRCGCWHVLLVLGVRVSVGHCCELQSFTELANTH